MRLLRTIIGLSKNFYKVCSQMFVALIVILRLTSSSRLGAKGS